MKKYKRITENHAKINYENGEDVFIVPEKQDVNVSRLTISNGFIGDFVNHCEFISQFNCNEELGLTLKFYTLL